MLQEAQRVVERLGVQTQILAVSVLTHLSAEDLGAGGHGEGGDAQVENLTRLAAETGVGGCVCSPLEAALVRRACGPDFTIVCPGVRPADAAHHDQTRVMTPAQALAAGADYLVVGRPIRQAKEPSEAARRVAEEIAGALALGAR